MKIKLGIIIIIGFIFCMAGTVNGEVRAEASNNGAYIASKECPEGYINYASSNVEAYLACMEGCDEYDTISMGSPFSLCNGSNEVYYFPIICDGVITYIFRVCPTDSGYTGVMSSYMAAEIESLIGYTSEETPLMLFVENGNLIAKIGRNVQSLCQVETMDTTQMSDINMDTEAGIVELETVNIVEVEPLDFVSNMMSYVDLNITEYQGDNNWCTAYCLATCIRTKTPYTPTASGLMSMAHTSYNSQTTFPWNKVREIALRYGLAPTVLTSVTSESIIIREIREGSPVMEVLQNTYNGGQHCVVIRGYANAGPHVWSIWNPVCREYEIYERDGYYIDFTGYSYSAIAHAYNFD